MTSDEEKAFTRCTIRRTLNLELDDALAAEQIMSILKSNDIAVVATNVLYVHNYKGFGPMRHGEASVTIDGKAQHLEVLIRFRGVSL